MNIPEMSSSQRELIRTLAASCPGVNSVLQHHISDYGELLPHLFFGDMTQYAVELYATSRKRVGGRPARKELQSLLEILERSYQEGDERVQELISVSFLEHLPRPGEENHSGIRHLVGPALKRQLDVIG